MFFVWLFLFVSVGFMVIVMRERRNLWFGLWITIWLGSFYVAILSLLLMIGEGPEWAYILGLILVMGPAVLIILLPIILIFLLLYNGVKVLRLEGRSLAHGLAFLSGIGIIFFYFIFPFVANGLHLPFVGAFYFLVSPYITYAFFIFYFYYMASIGNFINFPNQNLDYLVVLGAGLNGEEVTPLLANRIKRAIKEWEKRDRKPKIIMSGGQGPDEVIAEGEAMKAYAIKMGVPEESVIVENKSTTTRENLEFSYALMEGSAPRFAIVTNYYHVFRALILARQLGISCIGYGANTKFYYSLNAYIREYIGYWSVSLHQHKWVLLAIAVFQILVGLVYLLFR